MMSLTSLSDPSAVQLAIAEFDRIGRKAFLEKYGFGKADRYFLKAGDRYYDSKAIAGAAIKYQHPGEDVARFSGGVGTGQAADVLKRMHFTISDGAPKFLVLTQNVANTNPNFNWQDVTGERYHFPNQYRNLIRPGTRFVYYRGGLRDSGRRVTPEYFGIAIIGDVYLDETTIDLPMKNRTWFADILDFKSFANSVPFRDQGGVYLELRMKELPRSNYWRTAVREVERDCYEYICELAGTTLTIPEVSTASEVTQIPKVVSDGLMVERFAKTIQGLSKGTGRTSFRRLSGRAKIIGDLAESIVFDWLRSRMQAAQEKEDIVWLASQGETPGYDIEDRRSPRSILGYEVKATTGGRFVSIELTENEYRAAREMRNRYFLVLVAKAESEDPLIQMIQDPATMIDEGKLLATPVVFRLELVAGDETH